MKPQWSLLLKKEGSFFPSDRGDGETLGKMNERLSMKEHFVNNYIESTANLLESRIGTKGGQEKTQNMN
eukprot:scaffold10260_cov266-Chaetoceros_neogracile.AAC.40